MSTSPFSPVRKVVTVKATQARAFDRFTSEIALWWPLASHSVGEANAENVAIEGWVGGRIVERIRGGREAVWGTITAWNPPHRLAFTWHPGDEPAVAQDVEVSFIPAGPRTRVELEHRGFERLGDRARKARKGYPIGWAFVLGLYAERRGPFMLAMRALTRLLMAKQARAERKKKGRVALAGD